MKLASFERSQTSQGSKCCFIQLETESVQSAAEKQGQSCGLIHMMKLLSFFPSFFSMFCWETVFYPKSHLQIYNRRVIFSAMCFGRSRAVAIKEMDWRKAGHERLWSVCEQWWWPRLRERPWGWILLVKWMGSVETAGNSSFHGVILKLAKRGSQFQC